MKNNSTLIIGMFAMIIIGAFSLFYNANYVEGFFNVQNLMARMGLPAPVPAFDIHQHMRMQREQHQRMEHEMMEQHRRREQQEQHQRREREQQQIRELSGNEGEVANFNCAVRSGNIIYGANGHNVNYDIPPGSTNIRVDNSLRGDPIGGVAKRWNARYNCQ